MSARPSAAAVLAEVEAALSARERGEAGDGSADDLRFIAGQLSDLVSGRSPSAVPAAMVVLDTWPLDSPLGNRICDVAAPPSTYPRPAEPPPVAATSVVGKTVGVTTFEMEVVSRLLGPEANAVDGEEMELTAEIGVDLLRQRGVLHEADGRWRWDPEALVLLRTLVTPSVTVLLERTFAGETDRIGWVLGATHAVEVYTAEGDAVVTGIDPEDVHVRLATWAGLIGSATDALDRGSAADAAGPDADPTISFSLSVAAGSADSLVQLDWVELGDGARWMAAPSGEDGPAEPLDPELPIDAVQSVLDRLGAGVDV